MAQKYSIILADCPWNYNKRNNSETRFGIGVHRYPTMTHEELCALPIEPIAADNAALFMWITSPRISPKYVPLEKMFELMRCWGFRYVSKAFTWIKVDKKGNPRYLPGYYTGSNSEDCYLGVRGKMPRVDGGINQVIISQLGQHSRKPAEVRERIVKLYGDVPRVELFATEEVEGWDSIGLAVGSDINRIGECYD